MKRRALLLVAVPMRFRVKVSTVFLSSPLPQLLGCLLLLACLDKRRSNPLPLVRRAARQLCMLNTLEHTYRQWPTATADPAYIETWIIGNRQLIKRVRKNAEINRVDRHIVALYSDCINLMNEYDDFLTKVGAIKLATSHEQIDLPRLGLDSLLHGKEVGMLVATFATPVPAVLAGSATTIVTGGYDYWAKYNRGKTLDEDRQRALDSEARRLNAKFNDAISEANVVAGKARQTVCVGGILQFATDPRNTDLVSQAEHRPKTRSSSLPLQITSRRIQILRRMTICVEHEDVTRRPRWFPKTKSITSSGPAF